MWSRSGCPTVCLGIWLFLTCLLLSGWSCDAAEGLPMDQVSNACTFAASKSECRRSTDCYWCETSVSYGPSKSVCVDQMQAMNLPKWLYKCSHKKHGRHVADEADMAALTKAFERKPASDSATQQVEPIREEDCAGQKAVFSCLQKQGCVWCVNNYSNQGAAGCLHASQALYLPQSVYKCLHKAAKISTTGEQNGRNTGTASSANEAGQLLKYGRHGVKATGPQPTGQCSQATEKKKCLRTAGCYWCENQYTPGAASRCMDENQAKFLPEESYKCKASKVVEEDQPPSPGPQPGGKCTGADDKKSCLKDRDCYWCVNKYTPGSQGGSRCVDESQAKYLPDSVYKCKASKHRHASRDTHSHGLLYEIEEFASSAKHALEDIFGSHHVQKRVPEAEGLEKGSSPYGPPTPGGGGQGAGCYNAMDEKACLKIKDCNWCENKFTPGMGSRCMDDMQAKFLPDMAFQCKAARSKHKGKGRKDRGRKHHKGRRHGSSN